MMTFTESTIESAALPWLEAVGWRTAYGPDIAPDQPLAERRDYGEVVLAQRLRRSPSAPQASRCLGRPKGSCPRRRCR